MPTKYKPQLDHVGFDWVNQSNQFHEYLLAREAEILEKSGFYKEYGVSDQRLESRELIRELSGVISLAAAIRMDAGFKAPNKLISTLEAVEKDPLGMLASHYQRADERPGTFWWDVDRQENAPLPDPERVRQAASSAIVALKSEAGPGRPPDEVTKFVAVKVREIYLRYNDSVTRHSIASFTRGKDSQVEAGPFVEFLEPLLAPLNRFFCTSAQALLRDAGLTSLSCAHSYRVHTRSAATIVASSLSQSSRGSWRLVYPIIPIKLLAVLLLPRA
jgi:hypothetical protein